MTFKLKTCKASEAFEENAAWRTVATVDVPGIALVDFTNGEYMDAWRKAKKHFLEVKPAVMSRFGSGSVAIVRGGSK